MQSVAPSSFDLSNEDLNVNLNFDSFSKDLLTPPGRARQDSAVSISMSEASMPAIVQSKSAVAASQRPILPALIHPGMSMTQGYMSDSPFSADMASPFHGGVPSFQSNTNSNFSYPSPGLLTPSQFQSLMQQNTGYHMSQHLPDTPLASPPAPSTLFASFWEEEATNVIQMEFKGHIVTRRMDNHRVNGTKLLNMTGMTRGKRDSLLKQERDRHVIKTGAMHLKGVWIPLARAQFLATEFSIMPYLSQILQPTIDETALTNGFTQSAMTSNLSLPGPAIPTTQPIASAAQRRLSDDSAPIRSNSWSILQSIPETPRRSSMAGYFNMEDGALVSDFGSVYTNPVYQAPQFQLSTDRKRSFEAMSDTSSSTVVGDRRMSYPSLRRASDVSLSQFSTALPHTQHDAELEALFDSSAHGNANTANDLTTFWASMAKVSDFSLVAPDANSTA